MDDAIVVVEAVHAKLEHNKLDSHQATTRAMHEISGAIISITLVMAAVFIPVTFITGPTGVFYKQFGITLIVAIIISAVNALTLSPMLSALFLKKHRPDEVYEKKNILQKFFYKFNIAFSTITEMYAEYLQNWCIENGSLSQCLLYRHQLFFLLINQCLLVLFLVNREV